MHYFNGRIWSYVPILEILWPVLKKRKTFDNHLHLEFKNVSYCGINSLCALDFVFFHFTSKITLKTSAKDLFKQLVNAL